ncbi:hypothetical protein DUI87_14560 [Hirundo rustica rustica]|uniref:Uncharacterized protein n=1 Tax=Hirundo rustica rustica TaxID=333673 RepID=A0A3M0K534_HIRRU|nr:hypothetical protein DUI87_14560 [Hirundo rustica rustica]
MRNQTKVTTGLFYDGTGGGGASRAEHLTCEQVAALGMAKDWQETTVNAKSKLQVAGISQFLGNNSVKLSRASFSHFIPSYGHPDSRHEPPRDAQILVPAARQPKEKCDSGMSRGRSPDVASPQGRSTEAGSPGDALG